MYKVGDKFVLKRDHAILTAGELVEVMLVEEDIGNHYWVVVRSAEICQDIWLSVWKGEEDAV